MSVRTKRLERIVGLRGQLHERSVLALKMANTEVAVAAKAVAEERQQMSAYRNDQMAAISEVEHEQWLIARSGSALSSAAFAHFLQHQQKRDQLAAVVAQDEAQLRRELRQVERMMERAVREERLSANRKEQQQLDEVARFMGNRKQSFPLEVT